MRTIVALCLALPVAAHAQAYRCTDPSGAVRYQQAPCPTEGGAVRLMYESHPDNVAAERLPPALRERFAELVGQGKVTTGMTSGMVRRAWGDPRRINSSIRARSMTEQWVYANEYVYLENGVVTSISTSRRP